MFSSYNNDVMTMRNFLQFLDSPDKQQTAVLGIRQSSSLERHLDAYLDILSRNQLNMINAIELVEILFFFSVICCLFIQETIAKSNGSFIYSENCPPNSTASEWRQISVYC